MSVVPYITVFRGLKWYIGRLCLTTQMRLFKCSDMKIKNQFCVIESQAIYTIHTILVIFNGILYSFNFMQICFFNMDNLMACNGHEMRNLCRKRCPWLNNLRNPFCTVRCSSFWNLQWVSLNDWIDYKLKIEYGFRHFAIKLGLMKREWKL